MKCSSVKKQNGQRQKDNAFKFLDFKKNLKIELSSVGKLYMVSGILRNDLTCPYGNQASEYFDLDPPNLNDHFA